MKTEKLILIEQLCVHYEVEPAFFSNLQETGLIEICVVEEASYLHQDAVNDVERMVRIHHDLHVNPEGIDVVFNLLKKIDNLNAEVLELKNRLKRYEDS
ncbi:MAG: chaperone modulator CbpM [Flavobacteriales bacterium]|nr:chaperone modulator CbpM [Flavobacteriales bacterium]